jgi:general secretion pathway protein J
VKVRYVPQMSRGMTLVEVMVALALLSLLSVGVVTSFRVSERAYRQLTAAVTADRNLVTAQRFLRQILESTYPLQQPAGSRVTAYGLEGSETELDVTAPMPQSAGGAGNYRYELLAQRDDRGSRRLLVRWMLDRNEALAPPSAAVTDAWHEEVLLEGIESLEWAYLGREDAGNAAATGERRWVSSWTGSKKPPALVRLRVTFPPGDRRGWPELVIDPRVTDDSGCQFDVVSQACRES